MWITAFRKPDLTSTACSTRRETTGCSSAASRVARRRSITGRLSKTWSLRRAIQLRRMAHLLCPKRPKWPCRTADPLSGAGCGAQHPRHHQVPLLAHDGREPACRIRLPECGGRVCAGRYQGTAPSASTATSRTFWRRSKKNTEDILRVFYCTYYSASK